MWKNLIYKVKIKFIESAPKINPNKYPLKIGDTSFSTFKTKSSDKTMVANAFDLEWLIKLKDQIIRSLKPGGIKKGL